MSTVGRFQDTDEILLTPFISLFRELQWHGWSGSVPRLAQRVAMMWLEDLMASGVDLVEYGRKEKDIWHQYSISKDLPFSSRQNSGSVYDIRHMHVINVSFGAAPSDWHMWWSEPIDFLAGEFWAMIESPKELMPGSWIE